MTDPSFHDFRATTIDGEQRDMGEYRGRLVLVVNTATQCAFTPQLTALQELHDRFSEHGFTVLGFPSTSSDRTPAPMRRSRRSAPRAMR